MLLLLYLHLWYFFNKFNYTDNIICKYFMIFYIIFNIKSFLNVSRFQLSSVLGFQASCDVTTSHLYSHTVNTETFSFQQVNVKTASMCQTMRCGSNQNSLIETEVMKTER